MKWYRFGNDEIFPDEMLKLYVKKTTTPEEERIKKIGFDIRDLIDLIDDSNDLIEKIKRKYC